MLDTIKALWKKYAEVINYLFFGVLATIVNIVAYAVCAQVLGMNTFWATTVAWVISVLFAFVTNRIWVFHSTTKGKEAFREFYLFVGCRVVTYFTDVLFMMAAVDWFSPRYVPAQYQGIWEIVAKFLSNVIVVVLNYIFSKLIIFKKKS